MWTLRPELGEAALTMRTAAYEKSILPERLQEAVRYRISLINGCLICQEVANFDKWGKEFYQDMPTYPISSIYTDQEKLAILYAERYASDHHSLNDPFFDRMKDYFSDEEIVDLTFIVLRHISFGRLTHTLGLDDTCEFIAR
jgi:alkylhydroperoxidase family enzyme